MHAPAATTTNSGSRPATAAAVAGSPVRSSAPAARRSPLVPGDEPLQAPERGRQRRGEQRPARPVTLLEHDHVVPELRRSAGSLEPGRPGAHDDDARPAGRDRSRTKLPAHLGIDRAPDRVAVREHPRARIDETDAGRISAARPASALAAQSGSAISARPTTTASQSPLASAASATDGRSMPPTVSTGTVRPRFRNAASSTWEASGSSSSGIV